MKSKWTAWVGVFAALVLVGQATGTIVYYRHHGNTDATNEAGDTGLVWGNNPLTAYNGTELDSEGNAVGEPSLGDPPTSGAGWVFRSNAFRDAGIDGSQHWRLEMRLKWLSDYNNLYMQDGISDWNIFFYRNGGNGINGIAKSFAAGEPSRPPYYEQFAAYPGNGWHDVIMQYRPEGGGSIDFWLDGQLIRNIPRSDVPATTGNYLGFGGHSAGSLAFAESYWSMVELSDIPEPASAALLGVCALAMLRRRR